MQTPADGEQRGAVESGVILTAVELERERERERVQVDGICAVALRRAHESQIYQGLDVIGRRCPLRLEDALSRRKPAQGVIRGTDSARQLHVAGAQVFCLHERPQGLFTLPRDPLQLGKGEPIVQVDAVLARMRKQLERRLKLILGVELLRLCARLAVVSGQQSCPRR